MTPRLGEALAVVIVYLRNRRFFRKPYFRFLRFFHEKNRKQHFRFFVNSLFIFDHTQDVDRLFDAFPLLLNNTLLLLKSLLHLHFFCRRLRT